MVKESLREVYISILIAFYSAFIAFSGRVWRGCCWKRGLWEFRLRSEKRASMERVVVATVLVLTMHTNYKTSSHRYEKEAFMKGFFGGKRFPNRSHHHTNNRARQRPTSPFTAPTAPAPPLRPPPRVRPTLYRRSPTPSAGIQPFTAIDCGSGTVRA